MRYGDLPKTLPAAHLEIERLRHACAQAYQVMGVALIGGTRFWTDEEAIRALDNIVAAANGEPALMRTSCRGLGMRNEERQI